MLKVENKNKDFLVIRILSSIILLLTILIIAKFYFFNSDAEAIEGIYIFLLLPIFLFKSLFLKTDVDYSILFGGLFAYSFISIIGTYFSYVDYGYSKEMYSGMSVFIISIIAFFITINKFKKNGISIIELLKTDLSKDDKYSIDDIR